MTAQKTEQPTEALSPKVSASEVTAPEVAASEVAAPEGEISTARLTLAEESLDALFGTHDENLRRIETAFGVEMGARGTELQITGLTPDVKHVSRLMEQLRELVQTGYRLRPGDVRTAIRVSREDSRVSLVDFFRPEGLEAAARRLIQPRTLRQQLYLQAMAEHDLVISIGPAGTGKTYLAVAMAAAALMDKKVRRIVLARPAVEAGEKLGFLPGDLVEKVNPYLRPLHDALYDIIGYEKVGRMMEKGIIEVAPIAFMRGRTLNDSFIILDEAQNTTSEQMKMFLTRIGFGSKAVINGDITQVDLPQGRRSGLDEARRVLQGVQGIAFQHFDQRDVVRHPLVQKVVQAYEVFELRREAERESRRAAAREGRSEERDSPRPEKGRQDGSPQEDS